MEHIRKLFLLCLLALVAVGIPFAALAQVPSAVISDPSAVVSPAAGMVQLEYDNQGSRLFGVFYTASGLRPHPTVLLLHGFPGYEQNGDLAHAIRRAGWNVLIFHYRGAWGSHGNFSFTHAEEDTLFTLAYLRQNAIRLGVDPKRIVVIGHSMGGFMAAWAGAHDSQLAGVGLISAWDIGEAAKQITTPAAEKAILPLFEENTGPLAGTSAQDLLVEARKNAQVWDYRDFAEQLKTKPLLVYTSDDGLAAPAQTLAEKVKTAGGAVTYQHFKTDHGYSEKRIALAAGIINWLQSLPGAKAKP